MSKYSCIIDKDRGSHKMDHNKNGHLPIYGIGPILCWPMAMLTAVGIVLSNKKIIQSVISNEPISIIMTIIGILLIIEGIVLFFAADLNGNLQDNIKENKLKTNGSYNFVRNPCYCLFLLGCTGAILISHNLLLLVLPLIFYIVMTIVLKNTEEKWLSELYGDEYRDYCRRVNRCIPWFSKK